MSAASYEGMRAIALTEGSAVHLGDLPAALRPDAAGFQALWRLHPDAYHRNVRGGEVIDTPRWQQAFERDYTYAGSVNRAEPMPQELEAFLRWGRVALDARLNGLLVNWYDLARRHYIGRHKDSPIGLVEGAPIVTISLGQARTFLLERRSRKVAIPLSDGTVLVMPFEVNRRWSHQVPRGERTAGRRISITLRAFE